MPLPVLDPHQKLEPPPAHGLQGGKRQAQEHLWVLRGLRHCSKRGHGAIADLLEDAFADLALEVLGLQSGPGQDALRLSLRPTACPPERFLPPCRRLLLGPAHDLISLPPGAPEDGVGLSSGVFQDLLFQRPRLFAHCLYP